MDLRHGTNRTAVPIQSWQMYCNNAGTLPALSLFLSLRYRVWLLTYREVGTEYGNRHCANTEGLGRATLMRGADNPKAVNAATIALPPGKFTSPKYKRILFAM